MGEDQGKRGWSGCAMYLGVVCVREWIPIALMLANVMTKARDNGFDKMLRIGISLRMVCGVRERFCPKRHT